MKTTTILAVMSIAAVTNAQNLIDTTYGTGAGSFELPGFTNANPYVTLPAGSTVITGWTVDPTELDWVTADYWNASDGRLSLDLNGWFVDGGIHTVIPTEQGESYEVSFDLAGFVRPGSPSNPKSVEVSGGTNTMTYSLTVPTITGANPIAVTWTRHSFEFVASSTSSTLSFRSLVPTDASGLLLDNVSVELTSPRASIRVSEVEVCWTARTNKAYQVQYRSDLTTNTWINLGVPIPGSSGTNCIYDRVLVGQPQRFYRVITVP